jgi:transcriptional regulator with XRE-family HTH domain
MRPSDVRIYIGRRLAQERAALGITQLEFAQMLRCSQPQYGRYENGERSVPAPELYELSRRLQVPVESFFPAEGRGHQDTAEAELVEAWRSRNLSEVLRLVGERFG